MTRSVAARQLEPSHTRPLKSWCALGGRRLGGGVT